MKKIVDDDFLCQSGDYIDNATWDAIVSWASNSPDLDARILNAYEHVGISNGWNPEENRIVGGWMKEEDKPELLEQAKKALRKLITEHPLSKDIDGNYEWSAYHYGDINISLEVNLGRLGYTFCHPWEEEERICYCCKDRCEHCSKQFVKAIKAYIE